jgi:hypothetical protein
MPAERVPSVLRYDAATDGEGEVGMFRTRTRSKRALTLGSIIAVIGGALTLGAAPAAADGSHHGRGEDHRIGVPIPTVTGPVTGGKGAPFTIDDISQLSAFGYVQQEFFIQGTARAFGKVGTWTTDGRWTATPTTSAPYKTRILVRRPADPKRFNGTVFVEWLNVSAGFDAGADWGFGREELLRAGYAWVGVSAQFVGVQGSGGIAGIAPLKTSDPVRYASLTHPGDSYSYDIYSQAGAALRRPQGVDPLGGLHARRFIAAGESQSAFRMLTYVDAIHPLAHVYDGFFIHSRFATGAPLFQGTGGTVPSPTRIRTDLHDPVLQFQSETDVAQAYTARQPDSRFFRSWEVAGTSHADLYSVGAAAVSLLGCTVRINEGPEHFVLHDAIRDLTRWVADRDDAPPHSPRIRVDANGNIVRDQFGNALGGIRTPPLDVPTATLTGINQEKNGFCGLFGETIPFSAATLHALYPTHAVYVAKFTHAAHETVERGFLLPVDAKEMTATAAAAPIPS